MTRTFAPGLLTRAVAIAMIVVEIGIHLYLAPDHLREVPYIGMGFVAACVLLAGVAAVLLLEPGNRWGWLAGAALCIGMAVVFAASRLVGLPGFHESWTSDSALGLWSLPPEVVFLVCLMAAQRGVSGRTARRGAVGAAATV